MHGRYHVSYEDIKAVAKPVLRHRILTNFNAEADGISSLDIILLEKVKPPEEELSFHLRLLWLQIGGLIHFDECKRSKPF